MPFTCSSYKNSNILCSPHPHPARRMSLLFLASTNAYCSTIAHFLRAIISHLRAPKIFCAAISLKQLAPKRYTWKSRIICIIIISSSYLNLRYIMHCDIAMWAKPKRRETKNWRKMRSNKNAKPKMLNINSYFILFSMVVYSIWSCASLNMRTGVVHPALVRTLFNLSARAHSPITINKEERNEETHAGEKH